MAEPTSEEACVERHRKYPYDVERDSMNALQRLRLKTMYAPIKSKEQVLDVGCNSGYIVKFVPRDCECHGVDVSPELIRKARLKLKTASVATAEDLPFEDNSMDVVVLGEIIEHVFRPEIILQEASRVARRLVLGSTPHESGTWGEHRVARHRFHVRCYTEKSLREELIHFGNVKISTVPPGNNPQMYIFEVNLED